MSEEGQLRYFAHEQVTSGLHPTPREHLVETWSFGQPGLPLVPLSRPRLRVPAADPLRVRKLLDLMSNTVV